MGLDMYIFEYKKGYGPADAQKVFEDDAIGWNERGAKVAIFCKEVVYWRKANSIHRWFVENVQNNVDDCEEHLLTKDNIIQLLALVKKAISTKDMKILPPQSGFFFGNTEDFIWWFNDMNDTKEYLTKLLDMWDENNTYYYHSSW